MQGLQKNPILLSLLNPPIPRLFALNKVKMEFDYHTRRPAITIMICASLNNMVKKLDLSICPYDDGVDDQDNF